MADRFPNWAVWRELTWISIEEAVALSLNIEPKRLNVRSGRSGDYSMREYREQPAFRERMEIAKRAIDDNPSPLGEIDNPTYAWWAQRVRPAGFVAWARRIGWGMPDELSTMSQAGMPTAANLFAWASYQSWTLIEAACLLAGIEPISAGQFIMDRKIGGLPAKIYNDLKDAHDLKQITTIGSRDGTYRGLRLAPRECVAWAASRGYVLPDALEPLIERAPIETEEDSAPAEETADGSTSPGDELAEMFPPVTAATLETIFPAQGQWSGWAERAKDNGLRDAAKVGRRRFNPYRAGMWFRDRGLPGWTEAHIFKALKTAFPTITDGRIEFFDI
jgi:hypothetical protein